MASPTPLSPIERYQAIKSNGPSPFPAERLQGDAELFDRIRLLLASPLLFHALHSLAPAERPLSIRNREITERAIKAYSEARGFREEHRSHVQEMCVHCDTAIRVAQSIPLDLRLRLAGPMRIAIETAHDDTPQQQSPALRRPWTEYRARILRLASCIESGGYFDDADMVKVFRGAVVLDTLPAVRAIRVHCSQCTGIPKIEEVWMSGGR